MNDFYPSNGTAKYALRETRDTVTDDEWVVDTLPFGDDETSIVLRRGEEFESVHDPYPRKYDQGATARWYIPAIELSEYASRFATEDSDFTISSIRTVDNEHYTSSNQIPGDEEIYIDAIWITDGNGNSVMIDRRGNVVVYGYGEETASAVEDMVTKYVSFTCGMFSQIGGVYDEYGLKTVESKFTGESEVSVPIAVEFGEEITKEQFNTVRENLYNHRIVTSESRGDGTDTYFQYELIDTHTYNRIKIKYHHGSARLYAYDDETLSGLVSVVCLLVDAHKTKSYRIEPVN